MFFFEKQPQLPASRLETVVGMTHKQAAEGNSRPAAGLCRRTTSVWTAVIIPVATTEVLPDVSVLLAAEL